MLNVTPSGLWEGNDGSWAPFNISVGEPLQNFRVLPLTGTSQVWLPDVSNACFNITLDYPDCQNLRGASPDALSITNSSSWREVQAFPLHDGSNLFGQDNLSSFGLDSVNVNTSTGDLSLSNQLVASYQMDDFWLGMLGLGANITETADKQYHSVLQSWNDTGQIERVAYGYTAGAVYDPDKPAVLSLGGYENCTLNNITKVIDTSMNTTVLHIWLRIIVADGTFRGGSQTLLPTGGNLSRYTIDSSTAQLWLPEVVCDNFQSAFGLEFDESSGFYYMNETVHVQLQNRAPTIKVTLATLSPEDNSTTSTTDIILPYKAFDLRLGHPYHEVPRPYFPIRKAANSSQYVLGRVLLQEAFLAVDWENSTFTIGQLKGKEHSQPVLEKHSKAALAGTVTAIILVVLVAVSLGWWYRRVRPKSIALAVCALKQQYMDLWLRFLGEKRVGPEPAGLSEDREPLAAGQASSVESHRMPEVAHESNVWSRRRDRQDAYLKMTWHAAFE